MTQFSKSMKPVYTEQDPMSFITCLRWFKYADYKVIYLLRPPKDLVFMKKKLPNLAGIRLLKLLAMSTSRGTTLDYRRWT